MTAGRTKKEISDPIKHDNGTKKSDYEAKNLVVHRILNQTEGV